MHSEGDIPLIWFSGFLSHWVEAYDVKFSDNKFIMEDFEIFDMAMFIL
jgi:hypothetical protein